MICSFSIWGKKKVIMPILTHNVHLTIEGRCASGARKKIFVSLRIKFNASSQVAASQTDLE